MRAGYNRIFLDGILDHIHVTKHGARFSLRVAMSNQQVELVECGTASAFAARVILSGKGGDRVLIRGSLHTKPVRISVLEATVIGVGVPADLPAGEVSAGGPVAERAKPQESYSVGEHPRRLASGRVIMVKPHTRGGKKRSIHPADDTV
jgi:hypothetical protein